MSEAAIKQELTVKAILLGQCLVHIGDEVLPGNGITDKAKFHCQHFVKQLEQKEFKQIIHAMNKLGSEDLYITMLAVVDDTADKLSALSLHLWPEVSKFIEQLKASQEVQS